MARAIADRTRFLNNADLDANERQQLGLVFAHMPTSFEDEADYEAGQQFLNATAPFVAAGSATVARLEDERLKRAEDTFTKRFDKLGSVSPAVAAGWLPAMLRQETRILEKGGENSTLAPVLKSNERDINEIDRLQQAGDQAGAEALTARVQARLAARLSPGQEASRENRLRKLIDTWPLEKANRPGDVRAAYQKAGLGYLVDNLSDEALKFGSARAERRWSELLGKMQGWRSSDPPPMAVVRTTIGEMVSLGHFLGREAQVPKGILAQMDAATRARIQRTKDEEDRKRRIQQLHEDQFEYRKKRDAALDKLRADDRAARDAREQAKQSGVTGEKKRMFDRYFTLWTKQVVDKDTAEKTPYYPQQQRAAAFKSLKPLAREMRIDLSPWGGPDFSVLPPDHMPARPGGYGRGERPPVLPSAAGAAIAPPRSRPAPARKTAAPGFKPVRGMSTEELLREALGGK